jgi:hypothetical protein
VQRLHHAERRAAGPAASLRRARSRAPRHPRSTRAAASVRGGRCRAAAAGSIAAAVLPRRCRRCCPVTAAALRVAGARRPLCRPLGALCALLVLFCLFNHAHEVCAVQRGRRVQVQRQLRALQRHALCTARHSTAQHSAARHSTAQHGTAQHGTAQHGTARHSTARHSTARHSTAGTHDGERGCVRQLPVGRPVMMAASARARERDTQVTAREHQGPDAGTAVNTRAAPASSSRCACCGEMPLTLSESSMGCSVTLSPCVCV